MKTKKTPLDRNKKAIQEFKQKRKRKIIIYGASILNTTGNSKLIKHMAQQLKIHGHDIYTIAKDYNNIQIWYENIPVMPDFFCEKCGIAHIGSTEYVQKIATYLNMMKPDIFIAVGDPYQMQQYGLGKLDFSKISTRCIMYATMDSDNYWCNEQLKAIGNPDFLEKCDKIICTAKYGVNQIKGWLNEDVPIEVIYEPIDTNIYCPVDEKTKNILRKRHRFKEDDFIIYSSFRNIWRKQPFVLLDGIAKFLTETENTYLYLNVPYDSDTNGNRIWSDNLNPEDFIKRILKRKYNVDLLEKGRIIFVERGKLGDTYISEQENAELYRISDVYVSATAGEGMGLPPMESNACGVPSIIPDNSTAREITGYTEDNEIFGGLKSATCGILLDTPISLYQPYGTKQNITTPSEVYLGIKYFYEQKTAQEEYSKRGVQYIKKMFNLDNFRTKWNKTIVDTKKHQKKADFKKAETIEKKG